MSVPCAIKGQLISQICSLYLSPVIADRFARICLRIITLISNRNLSNRMSVNYLHSVRNNSVRNKYIGRRGAVQKECRSVMRILDVGFALKHAGQNHSLSTYNVLSETGVDKRSFTSQIMAPDMTMSLTSVIKTDKLHVYYIK